MLPLMARWRKLPSNEEVAVPGQGSVGKQEKNGTSGWVIVLELLDSAFQTLWICSKTTICDEEEERFPSEECALASRSHTAFPFSSLSPSASLVQSDLHLQETCGRFSVP